ncbi:MAG: LacI family DNA-binding transcriptional regulator [Scrofimicrobium sp.]
MKKVTIRDIAREANVSIATVSRVINHEDLVDDETKRRVLEAMEKHEYSPSLAARNLSKQASNAIGVIIPEIDNPFYGKILRTLTNMATSEGMSVVCYDTNNDPQRDLESLRLMREHRVCGLLYAPSVEYGSGDAVSDAKQALDLLNIPVVLIDREVPELGRPGVYLDNFGAGYLCAKILAAAGHRRIAIVTGGNLIGISKERLRGYTTALDSEGIEVDDRYVVAGDFTAETAYRLGKELLEMEERPTAVITSNNMTTLGMMQAVNELGIGVPDEVDLFGIDSIDAFDAINMSYNHVTRSRADMARSAMEMLLTAVRADSDDVPELETVIYAPGFVLNEMLLQAAGKSGLLDQQTTEKNRKEGSQDE